MVVPPPAVPVGPAYYLGMAGGQPAAMPIPPGAYLVTPASTLSGYPTHKVRLVISRYCMYCEGVMRCLLGKLRRKLAVIKSFKLILVRGYLHVE